jgi:hypothetical protein
MKYYYIDKKGKVKNIPEIEVTKCILIGREVNTKRRVKVLMDRERFEEWRRKKNERQRNN